LKFGREVRTPARQAGLTKRALTFREIFSLRELFLASKNVLFTLFNSVPPVSSRIRGVRLAAYQQLMTEAPCTPALHRDRRNRSEPLSR
jgi:hypothetical protein